MSVHEKLMLIAGMLFMGCFACATHKHVMHGWGWVRHRPSHEPHNNGFEKNDLYALSSAAIVVLLFRVGAYWQLVRWIALGMTVYGAIYAFVHDMLVHQRFGMRWLPLPGYLERLRQTHRLRGTVKARTGSVSFGFLFAVDPVDLTRPLRKGFGR